MSILKHFPFNEFRPYQREVLELVVDLFNQGYKYIIIEGPCGFGKTPVSFAIASYYRQSYILTTQKALQDQYINSHGEYISIIKGRSNYTCLSNGKTCNKGDCIVGTCTSDRQCDYNIDKSFAQGSDITLMNYSYLMNCKKFTDAFPPRELLLCDEAHSVEGLIMNFIDIQLKSDTLKSLGLPCIIPKSGNSNDYISWMGDIINIIPDREDMNNKEIEEIKYLKERSKWKYKWEDRIISVEWRNSTMAKFKSKIERFLDNKEVTTWIPNVERDKKGETQDSVVLSLKPINVAPFADDVLLNHCDKKVLMSATILDSDMFCKGLGIDRDKAHYIRVNSTFSRKNRRIHLMPAGNMGYKTMNNKKTRNKILENCVAAVGIIINKFKGHKGMVFTNNYKLRNGIRDMSSKNVSNRLVCHDTKDRSDQLNYFIKSNNDKVLLSPSFSDGIDLSGNLARFIIILKVAWGDISDPQIKAKKNSDPLKYAYDAVVTFEQILGRGVRSSEDYCSNFLLDTRYLPFINSCSRFIHNYIYRAVILEPLVDLNNLIVDKNGRSYRKDKDEVIKCI